MTCVNRWVQRAGASVRIVNSSPTLENLRFVDNTDVGALGQGGFGLDWLVLLAVEPGADSESSRGVWQRVDSRRLQQRDEAELFPR